MFRSQDGLTRFEVYYGIPLENMKFRNQQGDMVLEPIELTVTFTDKDHRPVQTFPSNVNVTYPSGVDQEKAYLPINLKLGGAVEMELDDYNTMAFMVDLNKLLVPTPPVYAVDDSTGTPILDENDNQIIEFGRDPDVPVPVGMIQSFQ